MTENSHEREASVPERDDDPFTDMESVLIPTIAVRPGMRVREVFVECGRTQVQALPYVDQDGRLVGRRPVRVRGSPPAHRHRAVALALHRYGLQAHRLDARLPQTGVGTWARGRRRHPGVV
jgi:hypothetical protein